MPIGAYTTISLLGDDGEFLGYINRNTKYESRGVIVPLTVVVLIKEINRIIYNLRPV
jgi:hypothetical protein